MASPFFVTIIAEADYCRKRHKLNNYKNTKYAPINLYKRSYYWIIINTLILNGGIAKIG